MHVIASVCDQGATNRVAINSLLADTNKYCIQHNINNRYHGYLVGTREVK